MESGVISLLQQAWLIGLLTLWFGLLYGGFIFGKPESPSHRRMPLATRIGSSAVLVISGWSWFSIAAGTGATAYAGSIAVGMSFGFLGDLVLARVIPVARRVLAGMALFGLGHIAYILAFAGFGTNYPVRDARLPVGVWTGWMLVGVLGWWLAVYRASPRTELRWAALAYSLLLASTPALATTLALQDANFIPTAVGASLFVISDILLATALFNRLRARYIHDLIWLTYGPAQMLIVYGVSAALRAFF